MTRKLLTAGQAAELLAVPTEHVRDLCRDGSLAAIDVSRRGSRKARWRIRPEALDDFLAGRTRLPAVTQSRRRRQSLPKVPRYV